MNKQQNKRQQRNKRKGIVKRKYPNGLFATDAQVDEFFDKFPTIEARFEEMLRRAALKSQQADNPCPFKDCPNRDKKIDDGNVVQFHALLFDTQECLERYQKMKNDVPKRWCYFDENKGSHHLYPFTATSRAGVNVCRCGYKEQVYDVGSKGWIMRFRDDKEEEEYMEQNKRILERHA